MSEPQELLACRLPGRVRAVGKLEKQICKRIFLEQAPVRGVCSVLHDVVCLARTSLSALMCVVLPFAASLEVASNILLNTFSSSPESCKLPSLSPAHAQGPLSVCCRQPLFLAWRRSTRGSSAFSSCTTLPVGRLTERTKPCSRMQPPVVYCQPGQTSLVSFWCSLPCSRRVGGPACSAFTGVHHAGTEHPLSYEELRREYCHVSPGLLPQLLAHALQAQRAGSHLLQGLDSLLGAGETVELSNFHY